jgi:hypothetical protein
MKKICLSLIATLMISSISFANTIEINETELSTEIQTVKNGKTDEDVRVCYLMSTEVSEPVPGIIKTTRTYMCVDHPEFPGNETIFIGR